MTKIGVEISAEVGGFTSGMGAASRTVDTLTQKMKDAKKEKNWELFDKLQMQRDSLSASAAGFKKDTNNLFNDPRYHTETASGAPAIKMDKEQVATFESLTDSIKKLTAKYDEQIGKNEIKEAENTFWQLQQKYKEYNKEVSSVTAPVTGPGQRMQDAVKSIGINQVASAINDGFSRWVGSLDRSGIVNQYGSGDILGGRISEERRKADLWGGLAQGGLGLAGTIAGAFLPGGPLVWGSLGTAIGKAIDTGAHAGPNKDATDAAYAGLWQNRSGQAMELAAVMGSVNDVRGAFKSAADAAAEFGYSAEEGMDALKQAAQQGLSGEEMRAVVNQSFDYERRTGADRGTLQGLSTMSARYGAGDALGMGWAGLQASGMKQGQYNEYLRAMQRAMEDGISKGFIRSSEQVVQNLTMLSQITGNNPLWQGENGARRLSEMNTGLEGTTGLSSTADILSFRAARNVLASQGRPEADYTDVMMEIEKGLTPALFKELMMLNSRSEGGSRTGIVELMRKEFGLNYINARQLYDGYDAGKEYTQAELDQYKNLPPPAARSPELDAAKQIEEIKNILSETGQVYWDKQLSKIYDELVKATQKYNEETGSDRPMPPRPETFPAVEYPPKPKTVGETLADLDVAVNAPPTQGAAYGDIVRASLNASLEAQGIEGMRLAEIDRMLMKTGMPWDRNRDTFFTGDANPFTKNDDERAYDRLTAYEQFPEAQQSINEAFDIMRSMTPDQVKKANEDDLINLAIPQDIMTDKTGRDLLEAIKNMKITIEEVPS
jgi:hypothetical protein